MIHSYINFYCYRIKPPPIKGKFIPISKWGPHDRYAPERKKSNNFSKGTTQKSTTITTPPYVTKPMRNTVIPFWFSNAGNTNYEYQNEKNIRNELIVKSTTTQDDFAMTTMNSKRYEKILPTTNITIDISEEEEISTTISFTHVSESLNTQRVYLEDSSLQNIWTETIPTLPAIQNSPKFKTKGATLRENKDKLIDEMSEPTTKHSFTFNFDGNQTNQEVINISTQKNTFSDVLTTLKNDLNYNSKNFRDDITEPDLNETGKIVNSEINFDNMKNTKNDLYRSSEDTVLNDIHDSTTIVNTYAKENNNETTLNSNQVTKHQILDRKISRNDHDEYKDKSLEDIQNELIKLLDRMTKKYHNASTVVI